METFPVAFDLGSVSEQYVVRWVIPPRGQLVSDWSYMFLFSSKMEEAQLIALLLCKEGYRSQIWLLSSGHSKLLVDYSTYDNCEVKDGSFSPS